MDASLVSLGVALVAVITALVGALTLARQRPRAVRAAQVRHPAATPPMSISLTRDGRDAHWQVGVRASAPPTSIDILSYRAAGSGGQWENEPIVTPIRLEPGEATVLSNVVVGRSPTYDVVVAWTEHRPDGDRTGSGTFTVHETGPAVATPPSRHRGWIVVAAAIAVLLVVAASLIVAEMVEQTGDDTTDPAALSTTSSGAAAVTTTSPTVTSPTVTTPPAAPETSPPATTAASTTAPTTAPSEHHRADAWADHGANARAADRADHRADGSGRAGRRRDRADRGVSVRHRLPRRRVHDRGVRDATDRVRLRVRRR